MTETIISAPLTKPPSGANKLASNGDLLVVWQWRGHVVDEEGMEYHFAIHSPSWGWRGYCWDKQYGKAWQILPVTRDVVWVHTFKKHLMRIQIGQNSEAMIAAKTVEDELLHANENSCLVKKGAQTIACLHFSKGESQLPETHLYTGAFPTFAYFLSDATIAIIDDGRLIVLSPEGNCLHEEAVPYCEFHPPFFILWDDNHLYYTDDPRNGWRKSNIRSVHRERTGVLDFVRLLTIMDDRCYTAFEDNESNVHLYRFSPQSEEHVEHVWGIKCESDYAMARHNMFICVSTVSPILGYSDTDIPQNDGFLVWAPVHNMFYTDIPRTTNIQKIATGRISPIRLPNVWGRDIQQR